MLKVTVSIVVLVVLQGFFIVTACRAQNEGKVRKTMVAGSFYPADPGELAQMVDSFLAKVSTPKNPGQLIGLIAPHAGYVYSGHVAAEAYAQLKGRIIERVIVISPSHVDAFEGIAIYDGDAYATPLGNIPVDKDFALKLARQSSRLALSSRGHETIYRGRGEHALEVHLPFLQRVLGDFVLVPLVMGDQNYETCRDLGKALARLIRDEKTIIVASSDLSHFHPYKEAMRLDDKVITAIREGDYFNLSRNLQSRHWEACGGGPIVALMIAAEALGSAKATFLKYANSGDVAYGDKSRVVGYVSFAFFKADRSGKNKSQSFQLNKDEQKELLSIAKQAVHTYVKEKKVIDLPEPKQEKLLQDRGVFVTLKINHQLRGCIGVTAAIKPLYQAIRDVAIQSAVQDYRFRPVTTQELPHLSFEISVLSPFQKVVNEKDIVVGEHGLLIKRDNKTGLLLPQVPVEQHWDRLTFLQQCCAKAGLSPEAWKDADTDIFSFTAFVFGDED